MPVIRSVSKNDKRKQVIIINPTHMDVTRATFAMSPI